MNSRVDRVVLRLRLAEGDRGDAAEIRRTVERELLQRALDELERLVHARHGATAIVRVRSLAARWRLERDVLGSELTALALGRDLADALLAELDQTPRPQRLRPLATANVVMFADDDHAIAAALADRHEGREAWFHAPFLDPIATWRAVVAQGGARIAAVEGWLERMELCAAVASWLARESAEPIRMNVAPPRSPRAAVPSADAPSPPAALVETPPAASSAPVPVPVAPGESWLDGRASESPEEPVAAVPTAIAGVWYLARLVAKLDLGEQLWAAGVVEGDFLAHVAAAIAGPDFADDPGWRWFGGAFDREPELAALPEWAAAELADKRAVSLHRRVPDAPDLTALAAQLPCLVPAEERVAAAVANSAAALVALFCAQLGVAVDPVWVRRAVAIPGRLELDTDVRVLIGMDLVDVDLRMAGIDFDPGFVPWLGRAVTILFEETERGGGQAGTLMPA